MVDSNNSHAGSQPFVLILSDEKSLSAELAERYKFKGCRVEIYINDFWTVRPLKVNYVVLLIGFSEEKKLDNQKIKKVVELARQQSAKLLLVLPFEHHRETSKRLQQTVGDTKNELAYAGVVYLAPTKFEKAVLPADSSIGKTVEDAIKHQKVAFPKTDRYLHLTSKDEIIDYIVKLTFSLTVYGAQLALINKPVTTSRFAALIQKSGYGVDVQFTEDWQYIDSPVDEKIYLPTGTEQTLKTLLLEVENKRTNEKKNNSAVFLLKNLSTKNKYSLKQKASDRRAPKTILIKLLFTLVLILLLPFATFLLSWLLLRLSVSSFSAANFNLTVGTLKSAEKIAAFSKTVSTPLQYLPVIGGSYQSLSSQAVTTTKIASAGVDTVVLTKDLFELTGKALTAQDYDIDFWSSKIALEIDALDTKLGFIQGELRNASRFAKTFFGQTYVFGGPPLLHQKLPIVKRFVLNLPELLGQGNEKKYVLVSYDSEILRPVGGVFTDFGILTFESGKLINSEFYDKTYLSNKFTGEIGAPGPIMSYLDKKYWNFEDLGWDPDFEISARKVNWYLGSAFEDQYAGVVAWNKVLLEGLSKDLQPGSVDEFITNFSQLKPKQKIQVVRLLLDGLDDKGIQLYFDDPVALRAVGDLNWGGALSLSECSKACSKDIVAVVESNFSQMPQVVNRNLQFSASLEEQLVKRSLVYYIDNSQNASDYRAYLRVIGPANISFEPVEVLVDETPIKVESELYGYRGFKEVGVFVTVPAQEAAAVSFGWEGLLTAESAPESYKLLFRKQPGVADFPLSLNISGTEGIVGKEGSGLTEDGSFLYNTSLSEDIDFEFNLKNAKTNN